jgi:hypothetical protein
MFDHVGFGVSDVAASKAFFLRALAPIGVTVVMEGPYGVGLGKNRKPSLWVYQAALSAGGKDNGPPGLRPHYHENYYGAFVIGPDGHNVEVVCHKAAA